MRKYGMKWSTIRYWQSQAIALYRTNGVYMGRPVLESAQTLVSSEIGHAAIALAAIASPEHLRAVLSGTRGRRWVV